MKLLLFDIDGTLLTTDGAGRTALRAAASDIFGFEEDFAGITISGHTDAGIVRDILTKHSIPVTERTINQFLGGYLARLRDNLARNPGVVLPGIISLLDHAQGLSCGCGLLTGNLKRGAMLKLTVHRLQDRFTFGAFADDHHDRNALGPIAKIRAERRFNTNFDPADIYVIGDTPRDIGCGKAFGAKTVAVATGHYSKEELLAHEPDFLFPDFSNTEAVLSALSAQPAPLTNPKDL
jgi:phosphoglycolate phosphatase